MLRHKSFARFVTFPENESAFFAVQDLLARMQAAPLRMLAGRSDKQPRGPNPLFLHGPPGSGKSHLAHSLAREVAGNSGMTIQLLGAGDFREPASQVAASPRIDKKKLATNEAPPVPFSLVEEAQECDLLILEDVQHLPLPAAETLVQIIDSRRAHQQPMVFTATMGPRHLAHRGVRFPARLTSRLAAGLVVALEPLKAASRQRFLEELAQRSQLALPRDIALWLARNLTGGGRQLEGAISQLETLNKVARHPCGLSPQGTRLEGSRPAGGFDAGGHLDLKSVTSHFSVQVERARPTMERIASQVGAYYRIELRQLQSRRRHRNILLPRQIGMYLARQLTALSLEQIGTYFGGRDHTTVLHACRKVEQAMNKDAVLSGTVRQIHAELS